VTEKYISKFSLDHDYLFISERVVAISQGRAYPISDIKPSIFAKFLTRFVYKSPFGIGLKSPFTMELAVKEAGVLKMLLACFAALVTKPFGMRGVFYKVVGNNINAIDGPCDYTMPPFNKYAKLAPKNPSLVAKKIANKFKIETVIIDANDLGVNILGKSNSNQSNEFYESLFKDNPLGQSDESTPLCLIKKID
jgi:F420-0:gamma-glutamyl ligase-like protein